MVRIPARQTLTNLYTETSAPSPSRSPNVRVPFPAFSLNVVHIFDEARRRSRALRHFHKSIDFGLRADPTANRPDLAHRSLDRLLPILRRIADMVRSRPGDRRKALARPPHDFLVSLRASIFLRQNASRSGSGTWSTSTSSTLPPQASAQAPGRRCRRFPDDPCARSKSASAPRAQTSAPPDEPGNQRAGGIDRAKLPFLSLIANPRRHAMRAENQHRPHGHFLDRFHENAPRRRSSSTTYRLCTISWWTYTGAP